MNSRNEQELLEDILEKGKPPIPQSASDLDYFLFTPFRYLSLPPEGSRFRAPLDPGVFYGRERIKTAADEISY